MTPAQRAEIQRRLGEILNHARDLPDGKEREELLGEEERLLHELGWEEAPSSSTPSASEDEEETDEDERWQVRARPSSSGKALAIRKTAKLAGKREIPLPPPVVEEEPNGCDPFDEYYDRLELGGEE